MVFNYGEHNKARFLSIGQFFCSGKNGDCVFALKLVREKKRENNMLYPVTAFLIGNSGFLEKLKSQKVGLFYNNWY